MPIHPGRPGSGPGRFFRSILGEDSTPTISLVSPNSDTIAGGTPVTIIGSQFRRTGVGASPTVLFNGIPATSVVVVDAHTITAVTPASASGVVDITITNEYGQQGSLSLGFTYVETVISDVSPNNGPNAGGTAVVILGTNFLTGSTVLFGGVPATDSIFVDSQHYAAVVPAGIVTGPIDVQVGTAVKRGGFFYTRLVRGQDIRRTPEIQIEETWGTTPNTCRFTLDGQSAPPQVSETVNISDYAPSPQSIYKGVVQYSTQRYEDSTKNLVWDIVCGDFTTWLNRRRPFGTYIRTSATDVVLDLVAKYAPWVTTHHVQTNLAQVTVVFDGTQDFITCLQQLGVQIGGGHAYLDYDQDLHFFHYVAPDIPNAFHPQAVMAAGGSPMTASVSAVSVSGYSFPAGYYTWRSSFLYDNGMESSVSPISNMLTLTGKFFPTLSNIPIGSAVGTLNVVGRRIYYEFYGLGAAQPFKGWVQINDNTTTSLTSGAGGRYAVGGTSNLGNIDFVTAQIPFVAPPPGSARTPNVRQSATYTPAVSVLSALFPDVYGPNGQNTQFSFTPGVYAFVETYVYQDGTESLRSDVSNLVELSGGYAIDFTAEIDNQLSSVPVVYRKIYAVSVYQGQDSLEQIRASFIPGRSIGIAIIPNNIRDTYTISPGVKIDKDGTQSPPSAANAPHSSSEDGPWLEDDDEPDTIDDANADLLRDTDIKVSVDVTQVRNRVIVLGVGVAQAQPVISNVVNGVQQPPVPVTTLTSSDSSSGGGTASYQGYRLIPAANWGRLLEFGLTAPGGTPSDTNPLPVYQKDVVSAIGLWPTPNESARIWNLGFGGYPLNQFWKTKFDNWSRLSQAEGRYAGGPNEFFVKYAGIDPSHLAANPYTTLMDLPDGYYAPLLTASGSGGGSPTGAPAVPPPPPPFSLTPDAPVVNVTRARIQVDDLASQAFFGKIEKDKGGDSTDGIHEIVIDDSSLSTLEQMYARGNAELAVFAWPIVSVTYATRDRKSKPGRMITIDLAHPPISGSFIIQRITIDQINRSSSVGPRFTVTASSVKFDLDDLLLLITKGTGAGSVSTTNLVQAALSQATTAAGAVIASIPPTTGGEGWTLVGKSADESANNNRGNGNNVVADDADLQFALAAGSTYEVEFLLMGQVKDVSIANWINHRIAGPADAALIGLQSKTISNVHREMSVFDTVNQGSSPATATAMSNLGSDTGNVLTYTRMWIRSVSSGTWKFQWVSGSSTANSATVRRGSYVRWRKM